MTTKGRRTLPVACPSPSYSPDGAFFACMSLDDVSAQSTVSFMRIDGTGRRTVATFPPYDGPDGFSSLDWTPDGEWLLVTLFGESAVLVQVSSGTVLPLRALPNAISQVLFVH